MTRGKRALRQGPARWATGKTIEPRDVGEDRQEKAVEAALVRLRTVRLRDQRIAVNKRTFDRACEEHDRLLALHMVQAHGVTRQRDAYGVTYLVPGVEFARSAGGLHPHHEQMHGWTS